LQGAGRQEVAIELSLEGIPDQVLCDNTVPTDCGDLCDAFFYAEWERYMVSSRRLVCVGRALDAVVGFNNYQVGYDGWEGSLCTPQLLGAGPKVVTAMGRGLTWDEAVKVATHPYIASIFEIDTGVDQSGDLDCPLDTQAPVPGPECTDEREMTADKWTPDSEDAWSASTEANDVIIRVRGVAPVCPAPSCPPQPNTCPQFELEQTYMSEWNWESQRCVRGLIAASGGLATEERFWLINIIVAELTWEQIQIVATHPHVEFIEPSDTGEPPP
jgi:hypothetical protein